MAIIPRLLAEESINITVASVLKEREQERERERYAERRRGESLQRTTDGEPSVLAVERFAGLGSHLL